MMQSTRLAFQQSLRPRSWKATLLTTVAIFLTGYCISLALRMQALDASLTALSQQQEEIGFLLERQQKALSQSRPPSPDAAQQEIQARLGKAWIPLLSGLDRIAVAHVSLLSLTPDAESNQLQLEIEAPSIEQAAAYADALGTMTALRHVHIVSQQPQPATAQRTGTTTPMILFILHAQWSAS